MKPSLLLAVALALAATGCPKKDITIYRKLSQGNAFQTCDANKRYRVEVKGSDAGDAKAKAESQIRSSVVTNKGCGAYVFNEGSGKALDGTTNHVADYQWCSCK